MQCRRQLLLRIVWWSRCPVLAPPSKPQSFETSWNMSVYRLMVTCGRSFKVLNRDVDHDIQHRNLVQTNFVQQKN